MINIDGSIGEGGGQILRTSLALALSLNTPFQIKNIRVKRKRPGLMRQHLVAVKAAAVIGNAKVEGAVLQSQALTFIPQRVKPGEYFFDIGTAGSTSLVLQTVLPALLTSSAPSELVLEGGTHNPFAPPFDFIAQAFIPIVNRMGPRVSAILERPGFYPVGGGRVIINIKPCNKLQPLQLQERGEVTEQSAVATVSALPEHIASRELEVIHKELGISRQFLHAHAVKNPLGPGNVVVITVKSEKITEVFTAYGKRGVRAETVALELVKQVKRYLQAAVPVGECLADQLLLPFALAEGGGFTTLRPSLHTTTNIHVLRYFLPLDVVQERTNDDAWRITIKA
jgi:RNA 3'-terminal phosphate cyclase (ATP)